MANVTDANVLSIAGAELDIDLDWSQFEVLSYAGGPPTIDYGYINAIPAENTNLSDVKTDYEDGIVAPLKLTIASIDDGTPVKTLVDNVESTGWGEVDSPSILELGSIYLNPIDSLDAVTLSYEGLIVTNESAFEYNQASLDIIVDIM
jgi:hypothetical protein